MDKLLKAFGLWAGFFALTILTGNIVYTITDTPALRGLVFVVGFIQSCRWAFRKAFPSKSEGEKAEQNTPLDIEIKITTKTNTNSDDKTDEEFERAFYKFENAGNERILKEWEISPVGQNDAVITFKKVINFYYKDYEKSEGGYEKHEGFEELLQFAALKTEISLNEFDHLASLLKRVYEEGITAIKLSKSYLDGGELDRESIMEEWEDKFSEEITEKAFSESNSCLRGYDFYSAYIKEKPEGSVSIFRAFGFNDTKLIFENSHDLNRGIFKCESGSYRYKDKKKLVEMEVLKAGHEIDPCKLLPLLKVGEIKELAKEKGIKLSGRKKDELMSSYKEQVEIAMEDIGKYIAIREVFAPNPVFLEKYDLAANKVSWHQSKLIAEYINDRLTYCADSKFLGDSISSSFNKKFIKDLNSKLSTSKAA